jgi:pyrimidine-nucleoside phosphorylase
MRAVDLIAKKRDGLPLTPEEIDFFIQGYAVDAIPDYQAAAWAMAVLWRGMTIEETTALTMAMVRSGDTVDLRSLAAPVVDKHSTGGVGDKTTLIVAPLVAALGLPVAKMSGRGLGYSGGTLDKLEAIPGMQVALTLDAFLETVHRTGIVVAGQTRELVPADGKLYALRDVTATVPSLPLIASSIMSKKIAGGAQAIVLDVKVGRGAFMPDLDSARALAETMIRIGHGLGRRVTAVISGMDQPLGNAIGNAVEVAEAIITLRGEGPHDLTTHCLAIAAEMALLGGVATSASEGHKLVERALADGRALERFRQWIAGQGGDARVVQDLTLLPQAPCLLTTASPQAGYLASLDAREVGLTAVELGAGRERKDQPVDPRVGIVLRRKVGDRVMSGEPLWTIHAASETMAQVAEKRLLAACVWSDAPVEAPPLIYDVIRDA